MPKLIWEKKLQEAAKLQLEDLGYQVLENDDEEKFLENSEMFDGDVDKGLKRYASN